MKVVDMTGQRVGRLLVLARAGRTGQGQAKWLCRCGCGREIEVAGQDLRSGGQRSCGCARARPQRTHGKTGTALYRMWRNIINRCEYPQAHNYDRYGGRGITICPEWRQDAAAFMSWCESNGYRPGLEIDRRDNDKGYTPDNCRFVTRLENQHNRSDRRRAALRARQEPAWVGGRFL